MFRKLARRDRGFTMIEMMVVLIIIAILIGAGIRFYSGYIDRSRITKARSDIATMQAALDAYYAENSNYPETDDLTSAGLPAGDDGVIDDSGDKVYTYKVKDDLSSYVVSTSNTVDGTNYVIGKGKNGRSEPPSLDDEIPNPE